MIGIYQVLRQNLKPLYQQAKTIASQFQSFNITYKLDVQRVANDILIQAASNGCGCVRYVEPACAPPIIIDMHRYVAC